MNCWCSSRSGGTVITIRQKRIDLIAHGLVCPWTLDTSPTPPLHQPSARPAVVALTTQPTYATRPLHRSRTAAAPSQHRHFTSPSSQHTTIYSHIQSPQRLLFIPFVEGQGAAPRRQYHLSACLACHTLCPSLSRKPRFILCADHAVAEPSTAAPPASSPARTHALAERSNAVRQSLLALRGAASERSPAQATACTAHGLPPPSDAHHVACSARGDPRSEVPDHACTQVPGIIAMSPLAIYRPLCLMAAPHGRIPTERDSTAS